jgi:hypothetical protein
MASLGPRLLSFLKSLSRKHGFWIYGNPVDYPPNTQQAAWSMLSQEELYRWHAKNDFIVCVSVNHRVPELGYPDRPKE